MKDTLKVFISMPFTGKDFEFLYNERIELKKLVESYGFELTEQFVGYQFQEDFASKDYNPAWVLGKDKNWLKQSDVVISDFRTYSLGTDFELVLSKEVFNKKVYAVVPPDRRSHPWLRFYCERYFDTIEDALRQIQIDFPDGPKIHPIDKRQYDAIAGEFRLIEKTDAQKYIYDAELEKAIGAIDDIEHKKIVVIHAGSGYRCRLIDSLGGRHITGIDMSYQNIRIAEDIEDTEPKGIFYHTADIHDSEFLDEQKGLIQNADYVIGYFALDHAMNMKELIATCKNIEGMLKPGGKFIGMSDNGVSETTEFTKYGVYLSLDNKSKLGQQYNVRRVSIFENHKEVTHFHNFIWPKDDIQNALSEAGLTQIDIRDVHVSKDEGHNGDFYWDAYNAAPDQVTIRAEKKK